MRRPLAASMEESGAVLRRFFQDIWWLMADMADWPGTAAPDKPILQ